MYVSCQRPANINLLLTRLLRFQKANEKEKILETIIQEFSVYLLLFCYHPATASFRIERERERRNNKRNFLHKLINCLHINNSGKYVGNTIRIIYSACRQSMYVRRTRVYLCTKCWKRKAFNVRCDIFQMPVEFVYGSEPKIFNIF